MDMKTVQKMQAEADNAKGELIANMQKTSLEAVKMVLSIAGLDNYDICEKSIIRMAESLRKDIWIYCKVLIF